MPRRSRIHRASPGHGTAHAVETALWAALRALEESASLYLRLAERAANADHELTAEKYEERVENTTANARVLREFLIQVNQNEEERFAAEQLQ